MSTMPSLTIQSIGREQEPLVFVDSFVPMPDALINEAKTKKFILDQGFYPGHRSSVSANYAKYLAAFINQNLSEVFGFTPGGLVSGLSMFACVSKSPQDLHPLQTIPHFDANDKKQLACIHYLCKPEFNFGGTSFYRHNSTGFECVDKVRFPNYKQAVENEINHNVLGGYMSASTENYTQIASSPAVFNRLLIYRATSLHSGDIDNQADLSADPAQGRLTITSFIQTV